MMFFLRVARVNNLIVRPTAKDTNIAIRSFPVSAYPSEPPLPDLYLTSLIIIAQWRTGILETQRRRMSTQLARSLGRRSAADTLGRIDSKCWELEKKGAEVEDLVQGPFSVFSTRLGVPAVPTSTQLVPPPLLSTSSLEAVVSPPTASLGEPDASVLAKPADPLPRIDECPQQVSDQLTQDVQGFDWNTDFVHNTDCDGNLDSLQPDIDLVAVPDIDDDLRRSLVFDPLLENSVLGVLIADELQSYDNIEFSYGTDSDGLAQYGVDNATSVPPSTTPCPLIHPPALTRRPDGCILPVHAESLFTYYKHEIFERNTQHCREDSPWRLFFFPLALETYAELSLWRETSQTRLALVFSLLSVSAFHRHAEEGANVVESTWHEVGVEYQAKAYIHLRNALIRETSGNTHIKYKELLMAILAISNISLSRGGLSRVFLLDAERLIRRHLKYNGATSFDFRLLHHMNSHIRVLSEIVGAPLEVPTDSPEYTEPPEKGGQFRLAEECYNLCLDPTANKEPGVAYSDIHLKIQGRWTNSLFPSVYGFPESLWTLLSQTITTMNEKARIDALNPPNLFLKGALMVHIQNLENIICSRTPLDLPGAQRPSHLAETSPDPLDQPAAKSLSQALHQAIMLYFYRNIFRLNPMILQDTASKIFDYIEPCMARLEDPDFAICVAWAVLVGACEATSPQLQERANSLLAKTDRRGIYLTHVPAQRAVASVWEKRQQCQGQAISWREHLFTGNEVVMV
ncbi:hypothetical protein NUW58_g71 [Xylaria curta]|uniref:Uncharacterized protein n=2 Tax=Xylaria curta TaxID=42375 RepID=A0ACC1PSD6_9PEZI|nr:hypothetical protein NUW58_g1760 [Xylaria curta]KAJ2999199.1 hypothetical protein NUW58_g71 [Xylaria curta]